MGINLKRKTKQKQPKKITTRNVGKLKLKNQNYTTTTTRTKTPTLLHNYKNKKRESSLLTHFELHTCFKQKINKNKQTKHIFDCDDFQGHFSRTKLVSRHHHHINSI